MENKSFATAINCMDGRTQLPVTQWLKNEYTVDYVDMITEPGPNKILAENKNISLIESIKTRLEISVKKHHSKIVALVGHFDCAGNPTDERNQWEQIKKSMETMKSWNFNVQIIGLWVDKNWQVNQIK
jgi:hypothetical protein